MSTLEQRHLNKRQLLDRITEQRQRVEQRLDRMDLKQTLGWFSIGLGVAIAMAIASIAAHRWSGTRKTRARRWR